MYHYLLNDAIFYNRLLEIDRLIASQVKEKGCPHCQGKLNQSHFLRAPRGIPENTATDYRIRFSYCCAQEGCRKRLTPPSMRFLSRKVYSSVIIFVIFYFNVPSDEARIDKLHALLDNIGSVENLSVETIRRWRHYWTRILPDTHTWKCSTFHRSLSKTLPVSLLHQFQGHLKQQLQKSLQWLLPLTSGVYLFDVPFSLNSNC